MIRRPPRSTLFPLHDALPISPTTLPSETPAHLKVATATWDYERREVMIPMRDGVRLHTDRKSTRLNSSHGYISYAVFCLKKKTHLSPAPPLCQDTPHLRLHDA